MTARTVYVNDRFLPEDEATVSVFDRGFLFADAVYEVTSVLDGRLVDFAGHMARLRRSLRELGMPVERRRGEAAGNPSRAGARATGSRRAWSTCRSAAGAADRDFAYPAPDVPATMVLFTQKKAIIDAPAAARGLKRGHAAGPALGPARHQDRATALPFDGEDGGEGERRRRRLAGRGRLRHRRHLEQRLDRHRRRDDRHPRPVALRSCTASPARPCSAARARRG